MGAFTYSREEGTGAHALGDPVDRRTKTRRQEKLLEVQQAISWEKNRARVGQRLEVLVEGVCEETEHLLQGRLATQAPDIDGRVLINDGFAAPGHLRQGPDHRGPSLRPRGRDPCLRVRGDPLGPWPCRTVLGLGFTPRMPGTVGALVGVFLYLPAFLMPAEWVFILPLAELAVVLLVSALAVPRVLRATGLKDPPGSSSTRWRACSAPCA